MTKLWRKFIACGVIFVFINIYGVFSLLLSSSDCCVSLIVKEGEKTKYGKWVFLLFFLRSYFYILLLFIGFEFSSIFLNYILKQERKARTYNAFLFFVIIEILLFLMVNRFPALTYNWSLLIFVFLPIMFLLVTWSLKELIPSNKKRIFVLLGLALNVYFLADEVISKVI